MPESWPLFVVLLGVSALIAEILSANFFRVRASLTSDYGDRVRVAGTKIIADKYMPRLALLIQEVQERGLEPGDPNTVAELTSAEFFEKIVELYDPLRERSALQDELTQLKRRGERVAKLGLVFAITLPLSYVLAAWPFAVLSDPYKTITLTLWVALFVLVPLCGAGWNLWHFWRSRAHLDEALDSLASD